MAFKMKGSPYAKGVHSTKATAAYMKGSALKDYDVEKGSHEHPHPEPPLKNYMNMDKYKTNPGSVKFGDSAFKQVDEKKPESEIRNLTKDEAKEKAGRTVIKKESSGVSGDVESKAVYGVGGKLKKTKSKTTRYPGTGDFRKVKTKYDKKGRVKKRKVVGKIDGQRYVIKHDKSGEIRKTKGGGFKEKYKNDEIVKEKEGLKTIYKEGKGKGKGKAKAAIKGVVSKITRKIKPSKTRKLKITRTRGTLKKDH